MNAVDMMNVSRNIEQIKKELYELDVMYGKAKAQVLMSSCPIYTIDNDKIIRQEYSKDTQALLDVISKQHCEAIKALAERYGITINDADDGEAKTQQDEQDTTLSLEETIAMLLKTIPIENVEMSMFLDPRSQRELFYSKGEAKVMLERGDNVKSENIFTYTLKETGRFEKEEDEE